MSEVRIKRLILVVFQLAFLGQFLIAQIFSEGKPLYTPKSDENFVPQLLIEFDDYFEEETVQPSLFKKESFAIPIDVNINPDENGTWKELPELNKKIWLLSIKVEKASSLNLILRPFMLKEGVKLFFYDKTQSQVLGAITSGNNKDSGVLPLSMINGDEVYCELQMPIYQDNYGELTISGIGAGKPEKESGLKAYENSEFGFGSSKSCNSNVNCHNISNTSLQKRAVCKIVYSGIYPCTGTLINNLENDETPYVLTAAHCFNTNEIASEAVFHFGYMSPDCSSTDVKPLTISGASVVSAGHHVIRWYDTLDFVLLKLSKKPPYDYNVYYSGWDATNDIAESGYVMHHPKGDIMKISIEDDPVTTGDFGYYFDENTHWVVENYEEGTTEGGSSGSGLINQDGKLIGTLTGTPGGDGVCGYNINDYFQKFHHAFDDYKDKRYQLKHWLDPKRTGELVCEGYDPFFGYRNNAEKLVNFDEEDISFLKKQKGGKGYLAGHNYQKNKLFAEHFSINGSKYIAGAGFYPAMLASTATNQYVTFKVWEGGGKPGKVIYEKQVLVSDYEDLYLTGPNKKQLLEFDSLVLVNYDFYFGFEISYSGETFALKTYPGKEENNTAFTFINNEWQPLQMDGFNEYGHTGVELYAFDLKAVKGTYPKTDLWSSVQVYPNPAKDQIQLYFKDEVSGKVKCTLYNMNGQPVLNKVFIDPGKNMPLSFNLGTGVYILHVENNNNLIGKTKVLVF